MPQIVVPKEQRWPRVIASPISINGVLITVPNTYNLRAKQQVQLQQIGVQPYPCEIVTVFNETEIQVKSIQRSEDRRPLSEIDFKKAIAIYDGGTLVALEQKRNILTGDIVNRAVYAEEPTMALRTHSVDYWGRPFTTENPLPVQLSDGSINIGTVEANLEVQITHLDNWPVPGRVHDSVRIGDGVNEVTAQNFAAINQVALNVATLNRLVRVAHDEIEVVAESADGDPLEIEFRLDGQLVATINLEYNADGEFKKAEVVHV